MWSFGWWGTAMFLEGARRPEAPIETRGAPPAAPAVGAARTRKAVVVQRSDMYANAVKPSVLASHLHSLGFQVRRIESAAIGRNGNSGARRWLPELRARSLLVYAADAAQAVARTMVRWWDTRLTRYVNGTTLVWTMRRRGQFLADELSGCGYDLLICESNLDQAVMLHRVAAKQVLDLPSPFGDELLFANQLSSRSHRRMRELQTQCLSSGDRVSFHWHTYEQYVRQSYHPPARWLECWYGVSPKAVRARFSSEPRVVFLGSLRGAWVNLPLLQRLSELYNIDVLGRPSPSQERRHPLPRVCPKPGRLG